LSEARHDADEKREGEKTEDEKTEEKEESHGGMTESEMRANFLRLVFGGDATRHDRFVEELATHIPAESAAVVRGSAVTGRRATDGSPFDADGPGTSDIDLTIVGKDLLGAFAPEAFYIPGVHTKPLGPDYPDIAPSLVPLRERLTAIAGRPVTIQCTRDWVMFVRDYLMGQPFLTIVGKLESP
jgi:hypothetical protein